jgi:urease subunit alpha
MAELSRRAYADLYGPTKGDKFRIADSSLIAEVEEDLLVPGDETVFGGGKTIRDGMSQTPGWRNDEGALDFVVTNLIIMDPVIGIVKADLGIKDGKIAGIGKSGNPYIMDGVTPGMVVGAGTEALAGEGCIATAGGTDSHIHNICPQQAYDALSNGITTMIGGGTGPADGTCATTCTPGPWNISRMLEAAEGLPVNLGFLGKGNDSRPGPLAEQIEAGACGLKDHEDWGTTPAILDMSLRVADEYDVQVAMHTDSLNESGYVQDSIEAIGGRTIHSFHTEGAGGGHAPDIMIVAGLDNILPSSTNPTRPYTIDTVDEHLDMLMVCHHLNPAVPSDVAFAESRIRAETIAAEDVLHDMGLISMYSSDSQAMGRLGENFTKLVQTASKMRDQRGALAEDAGKGNDNNRILRYIAKITANPAITHGCGDIIGTLEVGKMADVVVWPIRSFGAKPKLVIKGGFVNWAVMGDPNASLPTPEPVIYRPMFGAFGKALQSTRVSFMSKAAVELGVPEKLGLESQVHAVSNCTKIGKKDMVRNGTIANITIDPETYQVKVDGQVATSEPAETLCLTQKYYLM